jgi:L-ascorbate metabolism protein UlaG (beta-lactamase superfamily)
MLGIAMSSLLALAPLQDTLEIRLVANAGVALSDGETTLLVDLPYRPGAHGYAVYDPEAIAVTGRVVSVITHEHEDHFDPDLFLATDWELIGGPAVAAPVPASRVLPGDSVQVGAFSVIALATEHIPEHRSYRIRWRDRVIFLTGDAEDPAALAGQPALDVLFTSPWLSCALAGSGVAFEAERVVGYHLDPGGSDRFCRRPFPLDEGDSILLPA